MLEIPCEHLVHQFHNVPQDEIHQLESQIPDIAWLQYINTLEKTSHWTAIIRVTFGDCECKFVDSALISARCDED